MDVMETRMVNPFARYNQGSTQTAIGLELRPVDLDIFIRTKREQCYTVEARGIAERDRLSNEPESRGAGSTTGLGIVGLHEPSRVPHGMGRLWGNLGRWVLAVTAATTPIAYFDARHELRRSLASSIVWTMQRKRGQRISLREARRIALDVLAATEQRLHEERIAEARFLLQVWDDEGVADT